jgi:ATP-dependent exoDNAse (exonuclease V) beta subunit
VHRAIGVLLGERREIDEVVAESAAHGGVPAELLGEVEADVRRCLAAIDRLGFGAGASVRLEYPVAGPANEHDLLIGAIDLLVLDRDTLWVIDFKTDRPPFRDASREFPGYATQVRLYADLLARAGIRGPRTTKCALLFTADGSVHEIDHPHVRADGGPLWS